VRNRILVNVGRILDLAAGDDELAAQMQRKVFDLADELNSALKYETTFVHLDTGNYLAFAVKYAKNNDADRLEIGLQPVTCCACGDLVMPGTKGWSVLPRTGAILCPECSLDLEE
jgi:hypothetical protein